MDRSFRLARIGLTALLTLASFIGWADLSIDEVARGNEAAYLLIVVLVALLGASAIPIVEFATHEHRKGMSAVEAAIAGARVRLRPILMTSSGFIIAGMMPLLRASGAGAIGNRTIGASAAGEACCSAR